MARASASAERSRASASRKAASLRPSASRICDCFRPSASRICARLLRSAIICRPINSTRLAGGLMSLISTRVTLMPQGCAASSTTRSSRSLIVIAVGQQLVEVHRAHDRADVGHGQVEDGVLQPDDLIGGLRRVEDLVEGDAVDADDGVVAGDDLLRRHVEHLLHHVHLGADAVEERDDEVEAGGQRLGVAAEPLDRVVVALRHGLDAGEEQHQNKHDKNRR